MSVVAALLCAIGAASLEGCSTASPRFRAAEEDESRYASRIREEERRVGRSAGRRLTCAFVPCGRDSFALDDELLPASLNRDRVLLDIVGLLGAPYRYGGNDRAGIDCSGFTKQVYESAAGRALPRSREQYRQGESVERDGLRFGDLVFFNTTGASPSHVGIYIEDDLFAHASVTYGLRFPRWRALTYRERFVGVPGGSRSDRDVNLRGGVGIFSGGLEKNLNSEHTVVDSAYLCL